MFRKHYLWFILGVVGLFGGIRAASAQVIPQHPRPFICTPGVNCPTFPPSVIISPTSGSATSSISVTITVCDSIGSPSEAVTLNGTTTSLFNFTAGASSPGCHFKEVGTASVPLNVGMNTLAVTATEFFSGNTWTGSGSATYFGVRYSDSLAGGATYVQRVNVTGDFLFQAYNTGYPVDTFSVTYTCTFHALTRCTAPPDSVVVNPGQSVPVEIGFATGGVDGRDTVTETIKGRTSPAPARTATIVLETFGAPSASVSPQGTPLTFQVNSTDTVHFTVTNLETFTDTVALSCLAPGNFVASCTVAASQVIGSNQTIPVSAYVSVNPQMGTGRITLQAITKGTPSDTVTGYVNVNAVDRTRVLRIVAGSGIQQVLPGAAIVVPFTVTNNGNLPDTVTLSTTCLGSALASGCTTSLTSIPLSAGASRADTVRVTAGTTVGATGTVGLVGALATAGVRDSAYTDITIRAARSHGVELAAVNDFSQQTPFLCYTHAIVPRAAYECGNVRIAHALPAIRTYNKARVPTLLYSSQLAHPHPVISAIITLDSSQGTPDSVVGQLLDGNGNTLGHGSWGGATFAHGASRQVSIGYDANGVTTNEYSWKVQAQAFYADTMLPYVTNEYYALVSAQASHLGHGWTIAGIESMHIYSCLCSMIWSSADGSAEFYQSTGSSNTTFVPAAGMLTRPDTIKTDHSTGVLHYIRYAAHGVQVIFDSTGHHIMTRDRLGHLTTIGYVNGSDVSTITVPAPGATLTYQFVYDATTHMLDSVIAPSVGEPTRATKLTINSAGDVTAIRDPDGLSVTFNYRAGGDADVITSLVDRRGTLTAFTYDAARELATATIDSTSGGFNLTTSFAGADASTLTAALNPDSVSMLVNGPRTDVSDTARIWTDRFGQPVRLRDALGYETDLVLGNPTFPAAVTRLRNPNGHVTGATYDSRGNLSLHADSSIVVGGTYATTTYAYDGKFDFVTTVTPPRRDVTTFTYDTVNGNRLTETNALGDSTTISYFYGNADSLLSSSQSPHTAKDSIQYDAVFGNVVGQKTPLGYWTLTLLDGYSRDSMTISPIPAADKSHDPTGSGAVRDTIVTLYDAVDRPFFNQTISPTYNGVARQASSVTTNYDGEGAVLSTQIELLPDPNNLEGITTYHFYDRVGRLSFTLHPDESKDSVFYDAASNADTIYTRRGYKIAQAFDVLNRLTKRIVPSVPYPKDSIGIPKLTGYPSFYMTQNPPYGGLTIPGDSAAFGYDEVGNTVEADNADAQISRVYDAAGRLLTETQRVRTRDGEDFNTHVYTVTYGYDLESRRTLVIHPSQLAAIVGGQSRDTAIFGYDTTGRLQTVRDPLGGQFTYGYSARGDVISLAFPDGATVERFGTDDDGRITNDSIGPVSGPATARNTVVTYDARGKILTGVNGFGIKDNVTSTYSALGQVIAHNASYILPAIDGQPQSNATDNESYVLDPLGNHVSDTTFTNLQTGTAQDPTVSLALSGYRTNVGQQTVRVGGASGIHGSADSLLYDPEGNLYMSYQYAIAQGDGAFDLASYYGADGRLRMADNRSVGNPLARNVTISTRAVETYRYDALGRRVLKEADLWCANSTFDTACRRSTLRRIVWDGAQELDEIQQQDTSVVSIAEADTGVVPLGLQCSGDCQDNNKYFGRVLYTFGLTTDQPLAVTRVDYADSTATVNGVGGTPVPYYVHPPLTLVPIWNLYGRWDAVLDYECTSFKGLSRCVDTQVQVGLVPYDNLRVNVISYMGSLLEDKRDETGTRYRRSRTYNPTTGQFTQEDPLALAGGLNAYGFAAGDPVNYGDPFGLSPCPPDNDCGISASQAQQVFNQVGHQLEKSQHTIELLGAIAVSGPFAEEAIAPEVLGLGATLRSGAGASALAPEVTEGIYEFTASSGKTYVGQSGNIPARLAQHLRSGKLAAADASTVRTTQVLGGKTAREVAEQGRINQLGGILNLENKVNPIGPARQYLLPTP